jgi:hypothetical protein
MLWSILARTSAILFARLLFELLISIAGQWVVAGTELTGARASATANQVSR